MLNLDMIFNGFKTLKPFSHANARTVDLKDDRLPVVDMVTN